MKIVTRVVTIKVNDEWINHAYDQSGKRFPAADYYTDDKRDALNTASAMIRHSNALLYKNIVTS